MSTRDQLIEFLNNEFAVNAGLPVPESDAPLLSSAGGIVDSLGLQKLIVFIESELGIEVRDEDIMPQTFETIDALWAYIESRSSQVAREAM